MLASAGDRGGKGSASHKGPGDDGTGDASAGNAAGGNAEEGCGGHRGRRLRMRRGSGQVVVVLRAGEG